MRWCDVAANTLSAPRPVGQAGTGSGSMSAFKMGDLGGRGQSRRRGGRRGGLAAAAADLERTIIDSQLTALRCHLARQAGDVDRATFTSVSTLRARPAVELAGTARAAAACAAAAAAGLAGAAAAASLPPVVRHPPPTCCCHHHGNGTAVRTLRLPRGRRRPPLRRPGRRAVQSFLRQEGYCSLTMSTRTTKTPDHAQPTPRPRTVLTGRPSTPRSRSCRYCNRCPSAASPPRACAAPDRPAEAVRQRVVTRNPPAAKIQRCSRTRRPCCQRSRRRCR